MSAFTVPAIDISAYIGEGSDEERRLGVAMASGGDLDGDGYNDLVLGAPGYLGDDGRVVLVWGTEGL